MERDLEKKQAELAARLRESGTPPARDLWPEIAEKIGGTVRERTNPTSRQAGAERPHVPVVDGPPSRRRRSAAMRMALAATLAAVLIWGAVQVLTPGRDNALEPLDLAEHSVDAGPGNALRDPARDLADGPVVADSDVAIIDAALAEIKAALIQDPGNSGLYRMLKRAQQSRDSVLCKMVRFG